MKTLIRHGAGNLSRTAFVAVSLAMAVTTMRAQEGSTARVVVTAVSKAKEDVTTIPRQSISLLENRKLQELTGWVPLRDDRAGLQLVVMIDDASGSNLGLQLNDLKNFVTQLPPTTQVAVGYMRNGTVNFAQTFTNDHAAAAKALRLPVGTAGINGSPYFCLSELAKHWPGGAATVRREVIMVTDGVDRYSGARFDADNPYVAAATSDAQKAGIIVYSIYYRGAGRIDQNRVVADGGQNYLTEVSQSTGGQVYLEGFGNPVSFAPFLSDIQRKLQNQYELSFVSTGRPGLQAIRVKTTQPNTSLQWPARVQAGSAAVSQ